MQQEKFSNRLTQQQMASINIFIFERQKEKRFKNLAMIIVLMSIRLKQSQWEKNQQICCTFQIGWNLADIANKKNL